MGNESNFMFTVLEREFSSKLHEIFTADNQGVCILNTISHRMQ